MIQCKLLNWTTLSYFVSKICCYYTVYQNVPFLYILATYILIYEQLLSLSNCVCMATDILLSKGNQKGSTRLHVHVHCKSFIKDFIMRSA